MQNPLIPHTKLALSNGLEVILHEDHANPVVSVYVYYHVGSSREELGRSGYAHLFEHMLFQGSQNVDDNGHFRRIQEAGGTLNGTTNADRTNYFESLPANQLELALWLESDRMGFLLPALTQAKLDNQLDVVRNERRQSYENRPYGLVHETLLAALYPAGHPYSWPTIGSMEDLARASLTDIENFFRRWYGPNNATLVIGGDFQPPEALALVERYFGSIPRGPMVSVPGPEPAELAESQRVVLEDNVQLPQLTLAWPTVEAWHPEEASLGLLLDILSANKSSVLDRSMQIEDELVSHITAHHHAGERAGMLTLNLRPSQGVSLGQLEERVDELLSAFLERGVHDGLIEQLARMKARREGGMVRGLETVAQRTSTLGIHNCLSGDPARIEERFRRLRSVTPEAVLASAEGFLVGRPRVTLSVVPRGARDLAASARKAAVPAASAEQKTAPLDRGRAPVAGPAPRFVSPEIWHAELSNGVPVVGTTSAAIPLTRFAIAIGHGRLAETPETFGLAALTARMLDEGTQRLSGLAWTDELDGLGADLAIAAGDDEFTLQMSVLDEHLEKAVALFLELLSEPRFASEDFERVKRQQLVDIETRVDRVDALANDAYRRLLFGPGAKGAPPLGTEETVSRLGIEDVRRFWKGEGKPRAARLSFVGGSSSAEAVELLAELGRWSGLRAAPAPTPERREDLPSGEPPAEYAGGCHIEDKSGAGQSELRIGHLGIARNDPEWFPTYVMNYVLGGSFTSRINLNLREDKGYTYGVHSGFAGGRTRGAFTVSTAVESKVTALAVAEILKELGRIHEGITEAETEFARSALTRSLQGSFESGAALLAVVAAIGKYGWPDDYPAQRLAWLAAMTAEDLSALARKAVHPSRLCVVAAGNRELIEPELLALDFEGLLKPTAAARS